MLENTQQWRQDQTQRSEEGGLTGRGPLIHDGLEVFRIVLLQVRHLARAHAEHSSESSRSYYAIGVAANSDSTQHARAWQGGTHRKVEPHIQRRDLGHQHICRSGHPSQSPGPEQVESRRGTYPEHRWPPRPLDPAGSPRGPAQTWPAEAHISNSPPSPRTLQEPSASVHGEFKE